MAIAALMTIGAAAAEAGADEVQEQAISWRMDRLSYRIDRLGGKLDERLHDPEQDEQFQRLSYRVSRFEDSRCGHSQFKCGSSDNQCVSKLMLCDGIKDCRSGEDEANCDLPFKVKDEFYGVEIFDNCVLRRPGAMTVIIKDIQQPPFYPGHPRITAMVVINYQDEVIRGSVALPSEAYYFFSDRRLEISPPLPNVRRLDCHFDRTSDDVFIGDVMTMSHLTACARFRFHRK